MVLYLGVAFVRGCELLVPGLATDDEAISFLGVC